MSDVLAPYRVLDLTDERGLLCGQILGDLGADVIQIEPPGGSPARRFGPFYEDREEPERSLFWWAFNRNKRGITLDLEREPGRAILRDLVRGADFLIESAGPGVMRDLGIGYEALADLNPKLVYVAISPFGQDGPKMNYADADLVIMAAGGPMLLTGDDDRQPVRLSAVPQAYLHAAADGAVGALVAHHERVRSGRGQHVDVSAQQSVAVATQSYILSKALDSPEIGRISGGIKLGPLRFPLVWKAKDGHVSLTFLFGSALGPFSRRLMEFLCEKGFCDAATRDKDWLGYLELLMTGKEPIEEWERVVRVVESFIESHTKAELLALAIEKGFLITPVSTIKDVVESPQLSAREYFQMLEHPEHGREFLYPGPFARFSETPIRYRRRPPRIGEHNPEILKGSGVVARSGSSETAKTKPDRATTPDPFRALSDVKILDFSWVMAGPAATRMLADFGATIVRVESPTRIDTARTLHPRHHNEAESDASGCFGNNNAGKLGITLDLGKPEGRAVVLDLVRWADVVMESFSPKAMRNWGLAYDDLRKVNPAIIMLSSCLMGQTGPLSRMAGFGTMGAAVSGFHNLAGWADRAPAGVFGAYTDYVSPRFTAVAILAALEHRRRSGQGQYIDLSQAEASTHFLTPAILDYSANGREQGRVGNADAHFAPHGAYPALGDDRWTAIVCRSDEEWRSLCDEMGRADLATDARFATAAGRLEHHDEIDRTIATWTRTLDGVEIERRLQVRRVPAHLVQSSADCFADPQLRHRRHFVELEHPVYGTTIVEGPRVALSRTPGEAKRCAPTLGRDNDYVLAEILRYDEQRITELVVAGVMG